MIISILSGLFVFFSLMMGILVMIQQGKGDMGLGALHSGTQTLFGGSGGQTFFQKLTWFLGAMFLAGSLGLTVLKMRQLDSTRIVVSKEPTTELHSTTATPAEGTEENTQPETPAE